MIRENIKTISKIKEKVSNIGGKLISLCISGAHLYGFESKNSDIDYRGTFLANTSQFLGLDEPENILMFNIGRDDVELFELKKFVKLAIQGNCNILEWVNTKQILQTPEFLKLKQLINNAWSKKGIYNSYKGMAIFNYKKFILGGKNTVKKYLYVYRGLLAGIYALRTGKIEPNLENLNKTFKNKMVSELIKLKKVGKEKEQLPKQLDSGKIEKDIDSLFEKIDEVYLKSKIPEKAEEEDIEEINKFLIKLRKENL